MYILRTAAALLPLIEATIATYHSSVVYVPQTTYLHKPKKKYIAHFHNNHAVVVVSHFLRLIVRCFSAATINFSAVDNPLRLRMISTCFLTEL